MAPPLVEKTPRLHYVITTPESKGFEGQLLFFFNSERVLSPAQRKCFL